MRLRTVFLHVTKACNLACGYCYFSARRALPDELSTEELAAVLSDLGAVAPEKVVFTGGEPLLRDDLRELIASLRSADPEHRVVRCLNTNGRLVTRELARDLVGLADEVRVSLDGLRERNDALRGEGSFDAALRALGIFHREGFEPKVLVTLTRTSLPDLGALVALLRARGITRINANPFRPIGRGADLPGERVRHDELARAVRDLGLPVAEGAGESCGVGSFLNVMAQGDVFPCHVLTDRAFRLGNLREESIREIAAPGSPLAGLAELRHGSACLGDRSGRGVGRPEGITPPS